jgi:vancomycin resistance protein YoaR
VGRIYPNTYIAGIKVGGKIPKDAVTILSQNISPPEKIKLTEQAQSFELITRDIDLNYDISASVDRAYNLTRTDNFILDTIQKIRLVTEKQNIGLATNIDEEKLEKFTSMVKRQVTVNPVYPSIEKKGEIVQVNKGLPGSELDIKILRANLGRNLSYIRSDDIPIPLIMVDYSLDDKETVKAKEIGEKYLGKSINLGFESQKFNYKDGDLFKLINPRGGYNKEELDKIVFDIASNINRDPQNPKFEFNGSKVTEFLPALDGIILDSQKFNDLFKGTLDKIASTDEKIATFEIPVLRTSPDVSTDEVNTLGIKELIGRGESTYYHSIPGRVFNVNLAASKINGTLVKPGDIFSFNQNIGDISKITGYKEAYIIENGRTILGDGGGVCQVSTTLFRSVLNAGLPILERAAHAYRVSYYEQNSPPGFDATVYSPSPDFKFKNDTPGYILIQAKNNSKKYSLVFELYGVSDGRVATTSKPTITNVTPAPEDLYQDDPTLPAGQTKQIDYAARGAKVTFSYKVVRNGEILTDKNFVSNYKPWQAIYLRGTGPAI